MNDDSTEGYEPSVATLKQKQNYSQPHQSQPIGTIDMSENTKIDKLSLVPFMPEQYHNWASACNLTFAYISSTISCMVSTLIPFLRQLVFQYPFLMAKRGLKSERNSYSTSKLR